MKELLATALILLSSTAGATGIDDIINSQMRQNGKQPPEMADDAILARRYYLTITDRIPTQAEISSYLAHPDKEHLVDSLLASDGFVRKQVLKWGDLLRVKSEFPSCMWPNAVQAFNKWMTEEFRANTPYNEFVANLLGESGSNFRVPQTNFYRAGSDRRPEKFASDAVLLFLGRRSAPQEWSSFFCQVKFKSTKEWKEEILCLDIDAEPRYNPIDVDGKLIRLTPGTDFRKPFIEWLTAVDNRELSKAFVNRFWFWMMGYGLIEPVDDIDGRNAVNPRLLTYLTERFISDGWDVRKLAREILLSDAFCRSSISEGPTFRQRRLTAEQICDALCDITAVFDKYSSRAPEPFTNFPVGTHANEVCDGTITTPQLDIFGRPSRDVALESSRDNSVNAKQILYLLNASDLQTKLQTSPELKKLSEKLNLDEITNSLYLRILSRPASDKECEAVRKWQSKTSYDMKQTTQSLAWALLNTDEFLFL